MVETHSREGVLAGLYPGRSAKLPCLLARVRCLHVPSATSAVYAHAWSVRPTFIQVSSDVALAATFCRFVITLRASEAAAQCIVIGPVFGFVAVFVFVELLPR